ncbi:MAG: hypothetical protein H6704_04975 [Myxococcales bacterium]|nr:hypothetical protein [Myxococcales bacterium]
MGGEDTGELPLAPGVDTEAQLRDSARQPGGVGPVQIAPRTRRDLRPADLAAWPQQRENLTVERTVAPADTVRPAEGLAPPVPSAADRGVVNPGDLPVANAARTPSQVPAVGAQPALTSAELFQRRAGAQIDALTSRIDALRRAGEAPEALQQMEDRVAELRRDVDAVDLVPDDAQGELRVRVGAAVGELNNAVEDIRASAEAPK